MERHGDHQVERSSREELRTSACHEPAQGLPQRHLPAVLESLDDLTQRMVFIVASGITDPSECLTEVGPAREAGTAEMIFAGRIKGGTAPHATQRRCNE